MGDSQQIKGVQVLERVVADARDLVGVQQPAQKTNSSENFNENFCFQKKILLKF